MHSYCMIWMQAQQNWKSVSWLIQLPSIWDNPRVVSTLFFINHFPFSSSLHHLWLVHRRKSPWTPFSLWLHWRWFERNSSHYSPSIIYILIIAPNSCPPLWKRYSNSFSCASFGKASCPPRTQQVKDIPRGLKRTLYIICRQQETWWVPQKCFLYSKSAGLF